MEWKRLGDVADFQKGKTLTKNNIIDGSVPVIGGGQIPVSFHNESNRRGETIAISSSGAYSGFVSYWNIPVYLTDSFSVSPFNCLYPKYVFYFLKQNQKKIYNLQKGSGVPHVYSKDVSKIIIPIPPIKIQKEIVSILDKLDTLVNDISEGLPAEIQARRKQYEYYREKLLTFKNLDR